MREDGQLVAQLKNALSLSLYLSPHLFALWRFNLFPGPPFLVVTIAERCRELFDMEIVLSATSIDVVLNMAREFSIYGNVLPVHSNGIL